MYMYMHAHVQVHIQVGSFCSYITSISFVLIAILVELQECQETDTGLNSTLWADHYGASLSPISHSKNEIWLSRTCILLCKTCTLLLNVLDMISLKSFCTDCGTSGGGLDFLSASEINKGSYKHVRARAFLFVVNYPEVGCIWSQLLSIAEQHPERERERDMLYNQQSTVVWTDTLATGSTQADNLSSHLSLSRLLGVVAVGIVTQQRDIIKELVHSVVAALGELCVNSLHVYWTLHRGMIVTCRGRRKEFECQPQVLAQWSLKRYKQV